VALPFQKGAERARAEAREAIRDVAALTEKALAAAHLTGRKGTKSRLALQNAAVELKKHDATLTAYLKHLERIAPAHTGEEEAAIAEQRRLQQECVAVAAEALAQLEWKREEASAASHIGQAGEALTRMRGSAAKAESLSADVIARTQAKVIARLDREMKEVKMCVAVTVADRNRFEAAAGKNGPDDFWAQRLRAPDAETMARVLAAQKSAVEDLKEQLRDVNDRVEGVKRHARLEAAKRRLPK
jgi:hypothetical protein